MPYGDFALRYARATKQQTILHSYGAIQCLERLRGLLSEHGLILFNDYGQVQNIADSAWLKEVCHAEVALGLPDN